jgi:hypothetical protein
MAAAVADTVIGVARVTASSARRHRLIQTRSVMRSAAFEPARKFLSANFKSLAESKTLGTRYAFRSAWVLPVTNRRHEIAAEKRVIAIGKGSAEIHTRLHLFNGSGPGVIGAAVRSAAGMVVVVVGLPPPRLL